MTQIFVVFAFLLSVIAASPMKSGEDRVHPQPAALQGWKQGLSDKLCGPGLYVSELSGDCAPCTYGVDFTSYLNSLSSCLLCSACTPGEEEISPCTTTRDRECQCKPGTFHDRNSPEFCSPCHTRCPDGMVMTGNCTSSPSDLQCVKLEPGNSQLVIRNLPASLDALWVLMVLLLLLVLIACACFHWRCICQGCGVEPECMNRVIFWRSCPPRRPGALDNALNETVSNRDSVSTEICEQELGHQEHAELEGVLIQSPAEAEHLLGPAGADGSQMRREPMVPANDADPIEDRLPSQVDYQPSIGQDSLLALTPHSPIGAGLRLFFDDFTTIVPFNSWNPLMRLMGLSDNDICVARAQALQPREALYEMLVTWLSNKGRAAAVNVLLDALETLGDRHAKESIQDHLLGSGKYVYEEVGAGPALS